MKNSCNSILWIVEFKTVVNIWYLICKPNMGDVRMLKITE